MRDDLLNPELFGNEAGEDENKRRLSQVQICVYIHLPAMLVRLCCLYLQEI